LREPAFDRSSASKRWKSASAAWSSDSAALMSAWADWGLPDVLDPGARFYQPELRGRLIPLGPRPAERQLDVGGVETREHGPGRHAIPFLDRHVEQTPPDLCAHPDFGRFDVPHGTRRAATVATAGRGEQERHEDESVSWLSHVRSVPGASPARRAGCGR
jgi:hypothetical protein